MLSKKPKCKNILLEALAHKKSDIILPHLTAVTFNQKQVLYEVGDKIEYIYFMENGVASIITHMSNGASIEVGMIGYEGFIGASHLLGNDISGQHVVIQIPGKGYRIKASQCKAAFEQDANFNKLILRFVDGFLNLSSQTSACNRLHQVPQRCARWLLMSSDRAQSNVLPLTQEYLSSMIGVRRSGVSEAAGELQRAGLITYNQGHITITDRKGLEKMACECYVVDHERFTALLTSDTK